MNKIILFYAIILSLVLTSCTSDIETNEIEEIEIINTIEDDNQNMFIERNTDSVDEREIERIRRILDACENKSEGDECILTNVNDIVQNGLCTIDEAGLSCVLIEVLERKKQSLDACENKLEGDECILIDNDGNILNGLCINDVQGIACVPKVKYEYILAQRE